MQGERAMKTYLEARRRVNLDRHAPERQRDRGWKSLGEIAADLAPYFAALRSMRKETPAARAASVAGPEHGKLFSLRPKADLDGVREPGRASLARRLGGKARRAGARHAPVTPGGKAA